MSKAARFEEASLLEAKDLAKAVSSFVNHCSQQEYEAFAEEVLRDHRTLQQSTFGLFLTCIKAWAGVEERRVDPRNEWTVDRCREIVEKLGEYNLRPPLI